MAALRRRWRAYAPLALYIVIAGLAYAIVQPIPRYSHLIFPLLVLLAAELIGFGAAFAAAARCNRRWIDANIRSPRLVCSNAGNKRDLRGQTAPRFLAASRGNTTILDRTGSDRTARGCMDRPIVVTWLTVIGR